MKCDRRSQFATNGGGVIKSPCVLANQPKADVIKGDDLRNGKQK